MVAILAFGFTAAALTSWYVTGSDAGSATLYHFTWIVNLSLYPALSYFIATRLQFSRSMLKGLMTFFAVLGIYLSVTAFAEHYNVAALVIPGYILDPEVGVHAGRSRGPFVNTIANGGMLLLAFLAFSWFFISTTGWKRFAALVLALFTVAAVYFTETRSVWLSFALILATLLVLRTQHRRSAAVIGAVLAVGFVLGFASKFSAFDQSLFSRRQRTIDYRLDNFQIAWSAFKANPAFGLGYGNLQREWASYYDAQNSRLEGGLDDGNHNTVLGILADLGLAGGIPFVGMLGCASIVCFTAYRRFAADPRAMFERQFAVIAIGALEMFLILGLTSDLKAVPIVNIATFWLVGVVSSVEVSWRATAVPEHASHANVTGTITPSRVQRRRFA